MRQKEWAVLQPDYVESNLEELRALYNTFRTASAAVGSQVRRFSIMLTVLHSGWMLQLISAETITLVDDYIRSIAMKQQEKSEEINNTGTTVNQAIQSYCSQNRNRIVRIGWTSERGGGIDGEAVEQDVFLLKISLKLYANKMVLRLIKRWLS